MESISVKLGKVIADWRKAKLIVGEIERKLSLAKNNMDRLDHIMWKISDEENSNSYTNKITSQFN